MELKVTLTVDEYAVLESWLGVGEIEKWIQHALDNKIRQRVDASIAENTAYNPKKLDKTSKMFTLSTITLPTRKQRDGIND